MADEPLRVRAPVVRIVDHGDSTTVIGATGTRRFDGDSAGLLRAVLQLHARPIRRADLLAELARQAQAAVPTQPVDDLLALLVADGVLVDARSAAPRQAGPRRRVVLGISGAVAAVDAPALIRGLQAAGCEVRVAITKNAGRMVSRAAIEALTHHKVWSGIWQRDDSVPVPHVNLAEWAEVVLVCPASATTLSRIATGDCSDLVAAIVAATRAPVVVVPSMNEAMYGSPAVQANLATLRDHGRWVVHPAMGIEVAHPPHARTSMLGPAPPASAVIEIVRHLLASVVSPRVPEGPQAWEQLWSSWPAEQLPWHAEALEPALADAIAAHAPSRPAPDIAAQRARAPRLLDIGTGDGVVAMAAARCGFEVTAIDVAPSALAIARHNADQASARAIVFVLDDITAPRIAGAHDVAVDRGLLHALPRERWGAYAAGVAGLVVEGGRLLVVAFAPGTELGMTGDEVRGCLVGFELVRTTATTLGGGPAQLFELVRGR